MNFAKFLPLVSASQQKKVLKSNYLPKVLKEVLTAPPPRNKFHKFSANNSA